MDTPAIDRLRVWSTVIDCFAVTARHWRVFFGYAWPWLIVLAVVGAAFYWRNFPTNIKLRAENPDASFGEFLTTMSPTVVSLHIGTSLAVTWHRFLLLDEVPGPSAALPTRVRFLKYLGFSLLIVVPIAIGAIVSMTVLLIFSEHFNWPVETTPAHEIDLFAYFSFGIFLLAFAAFARVALGLPALAVEQKLATAEIFEAARCNNVRITFGLLLANLPSIAASHLLVSAFDPSTMNNRMVYVVTNVVNKLIYMIIGMTIVTFLSLAYRHFQAQLARTDLPID